MTYKLLPFDDPEGYWQPVRLAIPILATAGLLVLLLPVLLVTSRYDRKKLSQFVCICQYTIQYVCQ